MQTAIKLCITQCLKMKLQNMDCDHLLFINVCYKKLECTLYF